MVDDVEASDPFAEPTPSPMSSGQSDLIGQRSIGLALSTRYAQAANPDGILPVDADSLVVSTGGGPIRFPDRPSAEGWLSGRVGSAAAGAGQLLEAATHPDGNGATVRQAALLPDPVAAAPFSTRYALPAGPDGALPVDDDGFVVSTGGGPIRFPIQGSVEGWIRRRNGGAAGLNQILVSASHPDGGGFTMRRAEGLPGAPTGATTAPALDDAALDPGGTASPPLQLAQELLLFGRSSLIRPFVEDLTPLDKLPPGSAGGESAGKPFSRPLNDQPEGTPCIYCGRPTTRQPGPSRYNGDHIIPRNQGGNADQTNHGDACQTCNLLKGGRNPEQWYNTLPRRSNPDER